MFRKNKMEKGKWEIVNADINLISHFPFIKIMWEIIKLILIGLAGGTLGGMGMGGGTLLIPLLTVFCKVPQHAAQGINLISFVPMAAAALIIHFKKKLVDLKGVLYIIIPSCVAAAGAAFLAKGVPAGLLKRLFGGFIIVLGLYQIICVVIAWVKERKKGK